MMPPRGMQPANQRRMGTADSLLAGAVMPVALAPPLRRPTTTGPVLGTPARGSSGSILAGPGEAWGSSALMPLDLCSVTASETAEDGGDCSCSDATNDPSQAEAEPETARLRGELLQMQQALHHTQAALVGKYRGQGNKCVSGAQFRVETRRPENGAPPKGKSQPSPQMPHKCPECAALRTLLKRAKTDEETARDAGQGLRARLAESEKATTSLNHALRDARRELSRVELACTSLKAAAAVDGAEMGAVSNALSAQEAELVTVREQLHYALTHLPAEQNGNSAEVEALRRELGAARAAAAASETEREATVEECNVQRTRVKSLSLQVDAGRCRAEEAEAKQADLEVELERWRRDSELAHARALKARDEAHSAATSATLADTAKQMKAAMERERQMMEEAKRSQVALLEQQGIERASASAQLRDALQKLAAAEAARAAAEATAMAESAPSQLTGGEAVVTAWSANCMTLSGSLAEAEAEAEALRHMLSQQSEAAAAATAATAAATAAREAQHQAALQRLSEQMEQAHAAEASAQARSHAADETAAALNVRIGHLEANLAAKQLGVETAIADAAKAAAARARVAALEAQVKKLQDELRAQQETASRSRDDVQRMRKAVDAAEQAVVAEAQRAADALAEAAKKAEAAARQREALNAEVIDGMRATLQATHGTLALELAAADSQLGRQIETAASSSQTAALAEQARIEAAVGAARNEALCASAVAALRGAKDKATNAERAAEEKRLQVDRMTAHAAELDAELDRVRAGRDKELGNARRTSEAAAQELKAQLDRACAAQGAAQQRAALGDEKVCELQAQLEEALQSSVRLCVVAPTVNVTFGGQSLSSKAPLPKDKIRTALETQVLPNFTRCFIQPDESLGPEGGSMDDWLKNVTSSMQGSIEKHLTKVFRE